MKQFVSVKNKPLVSVVVPVYNNAGTIRETLDSILAQTYQNWEVICVDDGSIDETVAVINQYKSDNECWRIRLIIRDTQNKGGSICRNIGARAANGEYLIFLDADDLLKEDCLATRVDEIEGSNNLFVVFPMAAFENNDLSTAHLYSRLYVREPLYMFLSGFGTWQVTSPIMRRVFFDQIGGFDESFPRLQDVEFHIRAIVEAKGSYSVMRNAKPDCFYRQGENKKIRIEKLKGNINGFLKLISLICDYIQKGVFIDKKKLSLSLLSLYCHVSIYQDIIILQEPHFERIGLTFLSEVKQGIAGWARMCIRRMEKFQSVHLRLFVCRGLDKVLRFLIAR